MSNETSRLEVAADDVARYLARQQPGRQPLPIFKELARLTVLPTAEYIPLRRSPATGVVEVLLTKRPPTDPWWPGLWHNPGTVLLASDTLSGEHDYTDATRRVFGPGGELKGSVRLLSDPIEVGTERRVTVRGHEIAVIFVVAVGDDTAYGRYFALDSLPDDMVKHQIPSIKWAARVLFPADV